MWWGIEGLNAPLLSFTLWGFEVYAIIRTGGKQYKVAPEDVIQVEKLSAPEGEQVVLDQVLLVSDDQQVRVGTPYVQGAVVEGKVVRHFKGRKIRGFTYKPKKHSHRHYGHRQQLTSIAIQKITLS